MTEHAENIRSYSRHESVVFRKTNEEYGGLSNMAPNFPLLVAGVRIRTSEALYQACRFPHLPEVQRLILEQTSPMTAKMKSKPYRPQSREDWDAINFKVMRWCLRVKLAEHWEAFGDLLLATGQRDIVEESSKDAYWGALHIGNGVYRGENVLGRLLMRLRERLTKEPEALRTVEPLPIPQFLLLGKSIDTVTADAPVVDRTAMMARAARLEYLRKKNGD
ncbi:NADAR family protein [Paraburkholderia sp. MM6662-R1]|uniref:NADAR family protein n=1 Tax=Paraburkholderia sp. MM6662-R1 TaxID=2991066 RepID=UPI003D2357DE